MKKWKLVLGAILITVCGLYVHLWGEGKNTAVQLEQNLAKISNLLPEEIKRALPPYLLNSDQPQKPDWKVTTAGGISGRVTKAGGGGGILGVTVRASKVTCPDYSDYTTTDADGYYTISGLPAGLYEVWTDNDSDFVDIYWDDKTSENSDTVIVSGSVVPNIDFSLRVGGKITGTLTMTGSPFVMSTFILAFDATTHESYDSYIIISMTSPAPYTIRRLPTGSYKLRTWNYMGYIDVYYDDKSNWASANTISVTEGSTTSGKNFTLSLGGSIEGTVSSSTKGPIEDVQLIAYYVSEMFEWFNYGVTDENGDYSIMGLRSGDWKVFCWGDNLYAYEWYDNKNNWNTADNIAVTAPSTVSGKDFTLPVGGSISGHVYDMGGYPLSGCNVAAYETSFVWGGLSVKEDESSVDGSYMISGLRTGGYWVEASTECDEQWWDHASSILEADLVSVNMPGDTPDKNFNVPSAVEDEGEETVTRPDEFQLEQNYPNPFNPETQIEYTLQKSARVNLDIYNLLGQRVKTLVNEDQSPGSYRIQWDGKNEQGKIIASGIFFYKLEVNGVSQIKRMVLLK